MVDPRVVDGRVGVGRRLGEAMLKGVAPILHVPPEVGVYGLRREGNEAPEPDGQQKNEAAVAKGGVVHGTLEARAAGAKHARRGQIELGGDGVGARVLKYRTGCGEHGRRGKRARNPSANCGRTYRGQARQA